MENVFLIKPRYVDFNASKLLKEKGFPDTSKCFNEEGKECTVSLMLRKHKTSTYYPRPEQWQVVEWLLGRNRIHIQVYPLPNDNWEWCIMFLNEPLPIGFKSAMSQFCVEVSVFDSKQEAYSSAFDYILNNIL